MSLANISNLLYIVSAMLFIVGLKKLSNAETAPKGNLISALGMLLAVITAVISKLDLQFTWIIVGILAGALVGFIAAKKVAMTSMPEMIALFNGFGGIASLIVAYAEFQAYVSNDTILATNPAQIAIVAVTIFIGGVTFTGSVIAWAKLAEKMPSKAIMYAGQKIVNVLLIVLFIAATALASFAYGQYIDGYVVFLIITAISLIFGIAFVIPIGGGDMPVVISLLNAFSGIAACAAGFVISNTVLIVTGALVGSSGIILTDIMCRAMNRSLSNVLFSGFGSGPTKKSGSSADVGEVKPVSVEDTYLMLEAATNVLIVPGYGMAVAQAQHAVQELANQLEANGCEVNYAIHPVAGRMPGHMNVLLAEANAPYEQLKEMDDVNPTIENVDICIIIGANDIVNPAARTDEASPIYGMPIINVDYAKTVIVLKRSMKPGFAGIENPLFYCDNTRMLFGDAKTTVQALVSEFKS